MRVSSKILKPKLDTGYNSKIDMRTGTAHIKTGVDTAKHSESGGILNMKMCPEIYTWVGTLHIATSGESCFYSVSGGDTAHEIMFKCSYWGGDTAQNSNTED